MFLIRTEWSLRSSANTCLMAGTCVEVEFMKSIRLFNYAVAIGIGAWVLTTHAQAQDSPRGNALRYDNASTPMSLDDKGDKSMAADKPAAEDTGGFWIFPQPAPVPGPIVTDRPGFSDSASTVARGHF